MNFWRILKTRRCHVGQDAKISGISERLDNEYVIAEKRQTERSLSISSFLMIRELVEGKVTPIEKIAHREKYTTHQINLMISLAFLSLKLVIAAVEGRLLRGIGISNLRYIPTEWAKQHAPSVWSFSFIRHPRNRWPQQL